MTDVPKPLEIDQAVALDWLRYSLGQGDVISPAVLKLVEERKGRSYVLAPDTVDRSRLANPNSGRITGTRAAEAALANVLQTLVDSHGAACVVLEDELREKRDPNPSVDGLLLTGFVGEKVIHWAGLASGTEEAIRVLHRGSGGYPTNAFVTSASQQELGLADGADLDDDILCAVVRSLVAVVVAAYDAETFMIWEPAS